MNKFQSSDTSSLIIREKENRLEHYFGLEIIDGQESFFSQSFQIDTNNISKIFSWQTQLPLVDEKNYLVNNKKKIVRKYYYDDEKSIDEEAYYFIMDNRLVSYNSAAWNIQYFYEYEDSTIIGLLKNDTTSFFCRNCDVDMSKLLK
ncbi:hypothetical protein FHS70_003368 [Flammeovirga yaeyamensis]|nr:hypothetical protein [Flammeovirga yaeyamensis]